MLLEVDGYKESGSSFFLFFERGSSAAFGGWEPSQHSPHLRSPLHAGEWLYLGSPRFSTNIPVSLSVFIRKGGKTSHGCPTRLHVSLCVVSSKTDLHTYLKNQVASWKWVVWYDPVAWCFMRCYIPERIIGFPTLWLY